MYLHLSTHNRIRKVFFVFAILLVFSFILSVIYGIKITRHAVYRHLLQEFNSEAVYINRQFEEILLHQEAGAMLRSAGIISEQIRFTVQNKLPMDNQGVLARLSILRNFLKADIVYLMNSTGDVVASTSMEDGEVRSLTGHNYAFRPYFKGAIEGNSIVYPGIGITTHKKGVFYSEPVGILGQNMQFGVIVAKIPLFYIEQFLNSIKYQALLVNPQNGVFLSNIADWAGKQINLDGSEGLRNKNQGKENLTSCRFDLPRTKCLGKTFDIFKHKMPFIDESGNWHLILMADLNTAANYHGSISLVIIVLLFMHIIIAFCIYFYFHYRQRKKELQRSESLFRDMFERHSSVMLLIDSKKLRVFNANSAAVKFYGFKRNDLKGMMFLSLNVMDEKDLNSLAQKVLINANNEFICKHRIADGHIREVEMRANMVKMDNQDLIFAIINDVTEKRRTEYELIKAKEAAEEAVKTKSDFLANISHEIRTPMNSILGFAELLRQTDLDEYQKDCVQTLSKSGELLLDIINDVLNFSKLESSQIVLEEVSFNIEFLVEDVFKIMGTRFRAKTVDTYIDIEKNIPLNLIGDPTRLRQVLVNLLSNSIKFTKKGYIGISVALDNETKEENFPVLCFCVHDTGIGIPKDKQQMIFEAFSQADTSITRNYGGTGLGLSICKKIVIAMRGAIWVESVPNEGSKFFIKIPFKKGPPAIEEEIFPLSNKALNEIRAAIIDDNEISQKIHRKYCEDMGIQVIFVCASVQQSLEAMELAYMDNKIPDVILCDIFMKGMDGHEFVENLKKDSRFRNTRTISITIDKQIGAAHKAQETGFDAYLPKPLSRHHLRNVICTLLGDQRKTPAIVTRHMADEFRLKGVRILVAEDSESNCDLLQAYFNMLGCYGYFASNGKELIEKFNDIQYDLCLMDLHMPVMSGIEAAKIIRSEFKSDLPIIAVTAAVLPEERDRCNAAGINDFIIKPVNFRELKNKILKYSGR